MCFGGVYARRETHKRKYKMADTSLWRSQQMQLVQMVIPAEAAHDTVAKLGHVGMVQFKDLNSDKSAFQRTYANQVGKKNTLVVVD